MPSKLKVFRTAIGFHDAYVAAPSQKAALEAWGTDANLFARGVAELVSDAELSKEPLAHPGKVIKRLRGSDEEHFAALKRQDQAGKSGKPIPSAGLKNAPKTKPIPRPDRKSLDAAEHALDSAQSAAEQVVRDFRERERKLAYERQVAERVAEDAVRKARSKRDAEKVRHDKAMERWRA